jgi:FkbM family methyltransferase
MIVNRNDYNVTASNFAYGVGHQILQQSSYDASEVGFVLALLAQRRHYYGDGVVAIDGGANIGVHTVEWARHMHGWGQVLSFEAQEVIYYALAGNIALNNCLNARARLCALGESDGTLMVPQPDYFARGSFGSLELRQRENTEHIGQNIAYDASVGSAVPITSIDSLGLERVDLIKLDVEGMEVDVLRGARSVLQRLKPAVFVEILKSDQTVIKAFFDELGYRYFPGGLNIIAVHAEDPVLQHVNHTNGVTYIS